MKLKILIFLLIACFSINTMAQINGERFGSDYIFVGKGDAEQGADISFEKYEFRATFPKKLKKPGARIFHSIGYSKTNIDYGIRSDISSDLENFHSISYTFGFSKPIKRGWFLTAFIRPNVASNFQSSIDFDEVRLFGMALFSKPINQKKNLVLSLGALYSTTLGSPTPIPIASLMYKPNPKWTINFGFPRFDIKYKASPSTTIGTNLFIAGDNFTLTDNIIVNDKDTGIDNVRLMNIGGGLVLDQKITKKIVANLSSGYTFYRVFEFQDGTDSVEDFDLDNNFYIKAGISIKM